MPIFYTEILSGPGMEIFNYVISVNISVLFYMIPVILGIMLISRS